MQNCDTVTGGTEEVLRCIQAELQELDVIIDGMKSNIATLSQEVQGKCDAAFARLQTSVNTCTSN